MKNNLLSKILVFLGALAPALHGQMATNPIIYADVPDPDFVRVGDTYYMSSTTMYFNPGVPIMKSKDLVNWELVSYCYPIMANTDALNLNNGREAYSGGTWASSINYKNGTFYVSSFSYTTGKTYIYKTSNIETGPWTTITLNKVYHDHSILFDDDGKVYIAYGHDDIWLTELKPDLTGEQPGGVHKVIINKASSVAGSSFILTAEGTRLQKIKGTYYVSNICWPSGKGRTQILHKSSSVTGPYSGRMVFQSSAGSAQGEYIDRPDGKWYAMFFHDNGALGRIPDLMPVTWSADGWPTIGINGQVPATLDIAKGAGTLKGLIDSDEFASASPLKLPWQWNHNPQNNFWSLSQRSGYLRLTNERVDANVLRTTNTLTQRTFGPKCSGYISMDVSGMKDGDYAGIMALQNKYGFVGVRMEGTAKTIVQVNGTGYSGTPSQVATVPLGQNIVYLRIDFDFTNRTDKAYFYYSLNGTTWTALGSTLQMNYDLEHFTGYRFGLFSYATKSSGGYADFDFFRVGATISEAQNSQNIPPMVSLTAPANNSSYTTLQTITLTANANDADGISKVEFYNGNTLIATDHTAPYSYTWAGMSAGTHALSAKALDGKGGIANSAPVLVTVTPLQAPFRGNAFPIPGLIEAEHYDFGGEGIAYHEANANGNEGGNTLRNDEVDIETTEDATGAQNLGYILKGEWLEYTVNVTSTGHYDLDLRVASDGAGKSLHVELDGINITGAITVPNTEGWQTWRTITLPNISLTEGQKVMRVAFDADYMNLNWMEWRTSTLTDLNDVSTPSNIKISPDPFENSIHISCDLKYSYKVVDISGSVILQGESFGGMSLGTGLKSGIYVLQLQAGDHYETFRFLKK